MTRPRFVAAFAWPQLRLLIALPVLIGIGATGLAQHFDDVAAMIQFQRAADHYAFLHRQVERRVEGSSDRQAMADGMRRARPVAVAGDFFTPAAAAAFRAAISTAFNAGCERPQPDGQGVAMPHVNADVAGTRLIPPCLAAALPKLPTELEYRFSGLALLLVDVHAELAVDILPGAVTPLSR